MRLQQALAKGCSGESCIGDYPSRGSKVVTSAFKNILSAVSLVLAGALILLVGTDIGVAFPIPQTIVGGCANQSFPGGPPDSCTMGIDWGEQGPRIVVNPANPGECPGGGTSAAVGQAEIVYTFGEMPVCHVGGCHNEHWWYSPPDNGGIWVVNAEFNEKYFSVANNDVPILPGCWMLFSTPYGGNESAPGEIVADVVGNAMEAVGKSVKLSFYQVLLYYPNGWYYCDNIEDWAQFVIPKTKVTISVVTGK